MSNRIEEVKKRREIVKLLAFHAQTLFACQSSKVDAGELELYLDDIEDSFCQLFPQPLDDKELREKIISAMSLITHIGTSKTSSAYVADDILALLPSIEEALKRERERILGAGIIKVTRAGDILQRYWLKRGCDRGEQPDGGIKIDYQAMDENEKQLDIQIQW